ncbi:hypothetical protein AAHC03_09990 [Spirometra sp. Aus1]
MKLLIGVVLLVAALSAVVAGSPAGEQPSGEHRLEINDERSTSKKFADLLKEFGKNLVERLKKVLKEKTADIVGALVGDEPWGQKVLKVFAGKGNNTIEKFIAVLNGSSSEYENMAEYFKDQTDDILTEVFQFFGANGEDLLSVSSNVAKETVHALLTVFTSTLKEPEINAISAAVSGLAKTIGKIIKERSKWANAILDYLRDEVAKLVNILLKRWLDNEGTIYTITSKLLTAIQPAT